MVTYLLILFSFCSSGFSDPSSPFPDCIFAGGELPVVELDAFLLLPFPSSDSFSLSASWLDSEWLRPWLFALLLPFAIAFSWALSGVLVMLAPGWLSFRPL